MDKPIVQPIVSLTDMSLPHRPWIFAPFHTRSKAQNREWWDNCFKPIPAIASFVNAPFSAAVVSPPGGGKTIAVQALHMHANFPAILVDYHPRYWPGNADERVASKQHFSQVMAAIGLKLIEILGEEPERFSQLADYEFEFFVWMLHHYLGKRRLVRLGRQLTKIEAFNPALLEKVPSLYPEDNTSRSRREQLDEISFLVESLGYQRLFVVVDLNDEEFLANQTNVELFFQTDYLFQSNIVAMRLALPQTAIDQGYLHKVSDQSRFTIFYLTYTDTDRKSILEAHLKASNTAYTLDSICEPAIWEKIEADITKIFRWDALGGWIAWLDTMDQHRLKSQLAACNWEILVRNHYAKHYLLRLDPKRQGVWQGPQFKRLTGQPYEVLKMLFASRGTPLLESLINHAGSKENLQTIIRRIRLSIEPIQKEPVYLQNDNLAGYWLESTSY